MSNEWGEGRCLPNSPVTFSEFRESSKRTFPASVTQRAQERSSLRCQLQECGLG